ncbi:MAG: prolipoprotein diacylglyceryl transferase, partial [Mycoplasmataceae bacterium]|nr:prolipoprotein diacylglyceryl transferase [Mycoplasmataceae bacterium]
MLDVLQAMPPAPLHPWKEGSSEIAFFLGSFGVRWYSIFIFLGFMMAILIGVMKLWKLYKAPIEPFYWFCLMGIPTAILGARIWSCMLGDAKWTSFFDFASGGLAVEGGVVLTVLLACWWFPFILKKPKYQIRDRLGKPEQV